MLLADLLRGAVAELELAGVPSPTADAEQLLCHVLQVSRGELLTRVVLQQGASPEQLRVFAEILAQRTARVPLQHIVGHASFFGMDLKVGSGVFVPRPETEYLLDLVRQNYAASTTHGLSLLDIGTGSGAIACALQQIFPKARVSAIELDPVAADWAQQNFDRYAPLVTLERGDLAQLLPGHVAEFDLVVSNPPYIPVEAVPREPEVWLHDPDLALYSGHDGLDAIRTIANLAQPTMRPHGELWLEHADGQSQAIVELLLAKDWADVRAWRDLTGRYRYISASVC